MDIVVYFDKKSGKKITNFHSKITLVYRPFFAKKIIDFSFDSQTKVQNEPVEKKSSTKIGQKGQHPILPYNIDHFFTISWSKLRLKYQQK